MGLKNASAPVILTKWKESCVTLKLIRNDNRKFMRICCSLNEIHYESWESNSLFQSLLLNLKLLCIVYYILHACQYSKPPLNYGSCTPLQFVLFFLYFL